MGVRLSVVRCIALGLLLLALVGCGEMYRQPAFQPQEGPRLALPAGSVPITGVERTYADVEGTDLKNPIARDEASTNRGRILYDINCAMCHGYQGKGDGAVASAYVPQPADLTSTRIQGLTDGDLFLRITNGFSTMPAFRKQLTPNDRWQIVNYLRAIGQGQ